MAGDQCNGVTEPGSDVEVSDTLVTTMLTADHISSSVDTGDTSHYDIVTDSHPPATGAALISISLGNIYLCYTVNGRLAPINYE